MRIFLYILQGYYYAKEYIAAQGPKVSFYLRNILLRFFFYNELEGNIKLLNFISWINFSSED